MHIEGFGAVQCSSIQFSSGKDGICALGEAHMCCTSSLIGFPNVAFKTVPMFVSLTMALSRPFKDLSLKEKKKRKKKRKKKKKREGGVGEKKEKGFKKAGEQSVYVIIFFTVVKVYVVLFL